jgi:hypothetical protein
MFLAVAGETLRCLRDTWSRLPDEVMGEMARTAGGTMASTLRNAKQVHEGRVLWLTTAEAEAFRVAISVAGAPGIPEAVTAESDSDGLLGAQTMEVYATLQGGEAVYYLVAGVPTIYWRYTLRLVEA